MELKIDDGLKALLETGKRNGYLTYAQVKTYVPDESADSGRLDRCRKYRQADPEMDAAEYHRTLCILRVRAGNTVFEDVGH